MARPAGGSLLGVDKHQVDTASRIELRELTAYPQPANGTIDGPWGRHSWYFNMNLSIEQRVPAFPNHKDHPDAVKPKPLAPGSPSWSGNSLVAPASRKPSRLGRSTSRQLRQVASQSAALHALVSEVLHQQCV